MRVRIVLYIYKGQLKEWAALSIGNKRSVRIEAAAGKKWPRKDLELSDPCQPLVGA